MTVDFSGLQNKTHTQHCALTITSCFGTGAEAVALSPGGYDPEDRGGLGSVLLLDGGCGYAKLGRVAPEIGISGSGSGATFTPTLEQDEDECGCKFWKLASVAVSGNGTGYKDAEELTISIGGKIITKPVAVLSTERAQPTVTATVAGGSGAVLSVSLSPNDGSPQTWGVSAVTVVSAGDGYEDGASVTFSTPDSEQLEAMATITAGSEPDVPLTFEQTTGTGAALTVNWTRTGNEWCATSITIGNGGTGYTAGDAFYWQDFDLSLAVRGNVDTVDGTGAITAISVDPISDCFPGTPGPITAVTVTEPGEYFAAGSAPVSVTVTEPGNFYKEDSTVAACVADITITPCGGGSGAEITATVDTSPTSGTFGAITALTVTESGTGYLAWEWACLNQSELNGDSIVLAAVNPKKLVTVSVESSFGSGACITVDAVGTSQTCGGETITAAYDGQPGPIRQITLTNAGSGYARVVDGNVETATVTANIQQLPPSNGTGASITLTVNSDQNSPDFGKLTATLANGGSNYTILGGPLDCEYFKRICDAAGVVEATLTLRGPNKEPEVLLRDTRSEPQSYMVWRATSKLADCNSFPDKTTLLYGAPAGSVTITRGGTVTTDCETPQWCYGCQCPADTFDTQTEVTITSNIPCGDGTVSYEGPWSGIDFSDCTWTDPVTSIVYASDIEVALYCCEASCNTDGECILDVKVGVSGTYYHPDTGPGSVDDESECVGNLTFENGCPTGSVTLPFGPYSMTITFGGCP